MVLGDHGDYRFIGDDDGVEFVLVRRLGDHGEIDFAVPIYSSPIAANGVLYIATHTHLFAIAQTEK